MAEELSYRAEAAAEWIDLKQVQELEPDINPAVIGDVKRCVT